MTERERLAEIHAMPFGMDRARATEAYIRDYCRKGEENDRSPRP